MNRLAVFVSAWLVLQAPLFGQTTSTGPGKISIDLPPVVYVREDEGVLQVPVRFQGTLPDNYLKFEIVTIDGTAKAGSDYVRPARIREYFRLNLGQPAIVPFPPTSWPFRTGPWLAASASLPQVATVGDTGEDILIPVPITILNPPNTASEVTESFTVGIRAPKGSRLQISQPSMITVRIIDSVDHVAPKPPTISQPGATIPMPAQPGSTVIVSGVATDNKGVKAVEVSLNGAPAVEAKLTSPGLRSTLYSLAIQPQQIVNEISVRTRDFGNQVSSAVTRSFRFRVQSPLVVEADPALGSVTQGFLGTTSREVGVRYSVTATPALKPGELIVFDRWIVEGASLEDIQVSSADLIRPTLGFVHAPNLKLTAAFISGAVSPGQATHVGLLRGASANGFERNNSTSGFINLTVTKNRSFSAKVYFDGTTTSLTGIYGNDRIGQPTSGERQLLPLPRPGKPTLYLHLLFFEHPDLQHAVNCVVTADPAFVFEPRSRIAAGGAVSPLYDGVTRVMPEEYLGTKDAPGLYTSLLYAKNVYYNPLGKIPFEQFPPGAGFGNVILSRDGKVLYFGRLPDDTPFTVSTVVTHGGYFPVFMPLYDNGGFLMLNMRLHPKGPAGDMHADEAWWARPPRDTKHYPAGWPHSLFVDVRVAKYAPTPGRALFYQAALGTVVDATPHPEGNVALSAYDNYRESGVEGFSRSDGVYFTLLNLSLAGAATKVPNQPDTYTLHVDSVTGRFSGSYKHPNGSTPSFHGMIYQYGNDSYAHGYFVHEVAQPTGGAGAVYLSPVLRGN